MNNKSKYSTVAFIAYAILLTSCYALKITTKNAVPDSDKLGGEERCKVMSMVTFTKGIWQEDQCDSGVLAEVTIKETVLFSLANVVTLGIWKPVKVCYKCHVPINN